MGTEGELVFEERLFAWYYSLNILEDLFNIVGQVVELGRLREEERLRESMPNQCLS